MKDISFADIFILVGFIFLLIEITIMQDKLTEIRKNQTRCEEIWEVTE